jgi:Uma2 family endonuclease
MASATQSLPQIRFISVEEYLSTSFRPDVDYLDGFIEERNMGEADHGTIQFLIANYFWTRRSQWQVRMYLDTRMQISPTKFRVPDVSIATLAAPKEQIIRTPPLLCVEVLSPEDTLRKMVSRVQDYFALGVPDVWIVDPRTRSVAICRPDGTYGEQSAGTLLLPGTQVAVDLLEIFAALDED